MEKIIFSELSIVTRLTEEEVTLKCSSCGLIMVIHGITTTTCLNCGGTLQLFQMIFSEATEVEWHFESTGRDGEVRMVPVT